MVNINKRIPFLQKKFKDMKFNTKVSLYFATPVYGDDYDPFENNVEYSNLNPLTIKAYVTQVSPQALVYKQYGLAEMGAMEILCDSKYKTWFEQCNKIKIDGDEYQVFKEGASSRSLITERQFKQIRVVVSRREQ